MSKPTVLFKIGGSLLSLADLSARLMRVLPPVLFNGHRPLLLVGGGAMTDVIRGWDRVHGLGEEAAHHLAVRSLDLNALLLCRLLPRARVVCDRETAAAAWDEKAWPVLSVPRFLESEEPREADVPLPHTWEATSDSIAAWVAYRWPAETLVLLKSVSLAASNAAGDDGAVDACFGRFAALVPRIEWIDLRADSPHRELWEANRRTQ